MKDYLSREERENLIAMIGFGEWLENRMQETTDRRVLKWIRTAKTYLSKSAEELAMQVSPTQKYTIVRQAKDYTLEMYPNITLATLKKKDIYHIATLAREKCLVCGEPSKDCELRQILRRLNIKGEGGGECEYDELL